MSDRSRRRLAWALIVLPLVCVPAGVAIVVATGSAWNQDVAFAPVLCLAFSGVGLVVVLGARRNAVGWLLLAIGALVGLNAVTSALVAWDLSQGTTFTGAALNAGVNQLVQIVALGVLIPRVLLVFPSGSPPTPRWRVVGWAQIAVLVSVLVSIVEPGPIEGYAKEHDNPLGIEGLELQGLLADVENTIGSLLFVFGALGSVAALLVRASRSIGAERLQMKWVAWGVATIGAAFVANGVLSALFSVEAVGPFLSLVLCLFPVTVGIAILRYRLYEIDRLISRTLVYGAVSLLLGAAYVGLVIGGQRLFSSLAGGSNLAIAVSTLVVAALFLPVRSRVQAFVDRRFYRRRYDAQRTLEGFGARLREQIDLATLERDLQGVVTETMEPAQVSLWLRGRR
jgi:hypothetical protein